METADRTMSGQQQVSDEGTGLGRSVEVDTGGHKERWKTREMVYENKHMMKLQVCK